MKGPVGLFIGPSSLSTCRVQGEIESRRNRERERERERAFSRVTVRSF